MATTDRKPGLRGRDQTTEEESVEQQKEKLCTNLATNTGVTSQVYTGLYVIVMLVCV